MAISNEIEILSQASIYNKSNAKTEKRRKVRIYFSVPEKGVNEETGILLLISGFGANSNSKIYKKMRNKLSDQYNLVTVQCDYFGNEFMQESKTVEIPLIRREDLLNLFSNNEIDDVYKNQVFDFNTFLKHGSKYNITVDMKAVLTEENIDNFNDMGLMQAIDNITTVQYIINNILINTLSTKMKKVIIYGHSHGAYLAYLCNALAPHLFSMIIDNSAWLYPKYLFKENRVLIQMIGKLTLTSTFEYNAKNFFDDSESINLTFLYPMFKNKCMIVAYQGVDDSLVNRFEKKRFCEDLDNCIYNEIDNNDLDGVIFNSTDHGLNADFLELFYFTMNRYGNEIEKDRMADIPGEVEIRTGKHEYHINYDNKNGMPNLVIH